MCLGYCKCTTYADFKIYELIILFIQLNIQINLGRFSNMNLTINSRMVRIPKKKEKNSHKNNVATCLASRAIMSRHVNHKPWLVSFFSQYS